MTTKAEILSLAERVEAGSGSDLILRAEVFKALPREHWLDMDITISIDAVETLRERLLPGMLITIAHDGTKWFAQIRSTQRFYFDGVSASEPRARLAAVLRAYADGVE